MVNQKSSSHSGRVQDLESSNPQFKYCSGQKENLSHIQSWQYHPQYPCSRVKYLKLSEVKTWHHCGIVLESRTWDLEVPSSNLSVGKKKIPHRSNQNNTTTNPTAPELNISNYQRWKQEITGRVVECRTWDPEVPSWNLSVGKKKISHKSK